MSSRAHPVWPLPPPGYGLGHFWMAAQILKNYAATRPEDERDVIEEFAEYLRGSANAYFESMDARVRAHTAAKRRRHA